MNDTHSSPVKVRYGYNFLWVQTLIFSVVWRVINHVVNARWGSPLHACLASVNQLVVLAAEMDVAAMGPVACIIKSYCGSTAKTITLTTVWRKILRVDATEMHVSKFQ